MLSDYKCVWILEVILICEEFSPLINFHDTVWGKVIHAVKNIYVYVNIVDEFKEVVIGKYFVGKKYYLCF